MMANDQEDIFIGKWLYWNFYFYDKVMPWDAITGMIMIEYNKSYFSYEPDPTLKEKSVNSNNLTQKINIIKIPSLALILITAILLQYIQDKVLTQYSSIWVYILYYILIMLFTFGIIS